MQTTVFQVNALGEYAPDAVGLIGTVALRPDFPAGELARIKANLGRRLAQSLAQPGPLADTALARAYYGTDHVYGRPLPAAAQLGAYSIDDVKRYYGANFGAKRAYLYIAGRFDAAAVKAAIEQAFSGWAPGPDPLVAPPSPKAGPQVILVDRPNAPQSTIRLVFPAPRAGTASDIPLRVSNALLGGAFSSRITRNIREAKGYTYSPGSGLAFQPDDARWFFQADVTTASTGPALKEVFSEIRGLQGTAPGDEEAAGMRTYLAGSFVITNSTSPAVINTLSNRDTLGLPADWLDNYVPSVLAVSSAQISEAVKSTLPLDKLTLVVVGDLKTVEPQLKALPELANVPFQRVSVP
jgi:predicted Zn-dependent peptidase